MTDTTVIPPAPPPAPPPGSPPPAPPWHQGVDAEMLGHWQNKGWKVDDPKEIALAATKQARELEKHFGVPADQIIKMPKQGAPEADVKAFRQRLGMPADPKEYDFSTIKDAAGQPIAQALSDTLRNSAHQAGLNKEAAADIARAVQKHIDDARAADAAITAGKLAEERTKLEQSWGVNKEYNHLMAMEGARRLGITPEAVAALEKTIGYAAVMDAMRKIGVGTREGDFIERGTGSNGNPTTREGAVARLAELKADPAWGKRLLDGDAATRREWQSLEQQIAGETFGF